MEILNGRGGPPAKLKRRLPLCWKRWRKSSEACLCGWGKIQDDLSYERGAKKKLENFGLRVQSFVYPKEISHEDFMREFQKVNEDEDVDGILLLWSGCLSR